MLLDPELHSTTTHWWQLRPRRNVIWVCSPSHSELVHDLPDSQAQLTVTWHAGPVSPLCVGHVLHAGNWWPQFARAVRSSFSRVGADSSHAGLLSWVILLAQEDDHIVTLVPALSCHWWILENNRPKVGKSASNGYFYYRKLHYGPHSG